MHVQFWFDPACPFCWMTSRWLVRVQPHRDLDIEWLPISLLEKNGTREGEPFFAEVTASHGMLRVVEALRAAGHADRIGDLYTELGRALHVDEVPVDLRAVLSGLGLDKRFAQAADDERHDAAIRESMEDGLGLVGSAVGTPIIAVPRSDGSGRVGLFGPVITALPDVESSLRLWDGFIAMVETDGFYELKRTRREAPEILSPAQLSG
jgi:2-hydroxychromene-2-carboxylate isomerase